MNGRHNIFFVSLFSLFVSFSCSTNKVSSSKIQYNFKSPDGKPDYSNLDYWAAHPWKWDPSDSVPAPLKHEKRDSVVDVFFLHPTIYTEEKRFEKINVAIDDAYNNEKTDLSAILYQASAFNQHARVFAPRFREAHLSVFSMQDKVLAKQALDFAYEDVKASFEYYLKYYNNGRPIIIASHSQGTTHALRLLKEYFENKPLHLQLVTAYVIGMPIPENYFSILQPCIGPLQTGCFNGWRTFRKGYTPEFVQKEKFTSWVTNPLTWKIDNQPADRSLNEGSILINFNKSFPETAGAQVNSNILWVDKPKFPGGLLFTANNYHVADINLFYINIRNNVADRVQQFLIQ